METEHNREAKEYTRDSSLLRQLTSGNDQELGFFFRMNGFAPPKDGSQRLLKGVGSNAI
jgi:hypothetical protein